jgi:hypothetical protein
MTNMDDANRVFSRFEMLAYGRHRCPVCGQRTMTYSFADASTPNEKLYRRNGGAGSNMRCGINGGDQGEMPE